jgi:hypothetical protein
MVLIFPMLVSQAVSENSIPAIAKSLEIYIMGNEMSGILNDPNGQLRKHGYKLVNGKIVKEDVSITEQGGPPGSTGGTKGGSQGGGGGGQTIADYLKQQHQKIQDLEAEVRRLEKEVTTAKDEATIKRRKNELEDKKLELQSRKQDLEDRKFAEEEKEKKIKKATSKVTARDYKAISVEPVYIDVEFQVGDEVLRRTIGIKVLPLRVQSDVKLSHLMLYDYKLRPLKAALVSIGRSVMRMVYRYINVWRKRLRIGLPTPSGDPRRDILMARTGFSEPFVVLSKNEDFDDYFISNFSRIHRLSKMGWGNFIIADDINKQAYFCMKDFRGVCNVVSYAMMYNNVGQLKVYETLEDAKQKSSSLFKIPRKFSKVIGEWVAKNKLDKYLMRED